MAYKRHPKMDALLLSLYRRAILRPVLNSFPLEPELALVTYFTNRMWWTTKSKS